MHQVFYVHFDITNDGNKYSCYTIYILNAGPDAKITDLQLFWSDWEELI